eukprot:gene16187-biopygen14312
MRRRRRRKSEQGGAAGAAKVKQTPAKGEIPDQRNRCTDGTKPEEKQPAAKEARHTQEDLTHDRQRTKKTNILAPTLDSSGNVWRPGPGTTMGHCGTTMGHYSATRQQAH